MRTITYLYVLFELEVCGEYSLMRRHPWQSYSSTKINSKKGVKRFSFISNEFR